VSNTTNFVERLTPVTAAWLNDIDSIAYDNAINVKLNGVVGNGTTDDASQLASIIAAAPAGSTLFFPKSIYNLGSTTTITKRLNIVGEGTGTILRGTGTSDILAYDGAGDPNLNAGTILKDFVISGASTTRDALRMTNMNKLMVVNVFVPGCGDTAFHLRGTLLSNFINCRASVNIGTLSAGALGTMKNGFVLEQTGAIAANANNFTSCDAEGITDGSGIGLDIQANCFGNSFDTFTSEANTIGLKLAAGLKYNVFKNLWFEVNGTDISGSIGENAIFGLNSASIGGGYSNQMDLLQMQTAIALGATPATSGAIRLTSQGEINSKDSGGTNRLLMKLNSVDNVQIGDGTKPIQLAGSTIIVGGPIALGGGAVPTLGTIGGSGPAAAAQNCWAKFVDNAGNTFYFPAWR
jgi:hypothetical protein